MADTMLANPIGLYTPLQSATIIKSPKQLPKQHRLILDMQHEIILKADQNSTDGIRNVRYELGVANYILGIAV